jgi:hypothetical protein
MLYVLLTDLIHFISLFFLLLLLLLYIISAETDILPIEGNCWFHMSERTARKIFKTITVIDIKNRREQATLEHKKLRKLGPVSREATSLYKTRCADMDKEIVTPKDTRAQLRTVFALSHQVRSVILTHFK